MKTYVFLQFLENALFNASCQSVPCAPAIIDLPAHGYPLMESWTPAEAGYFLRYCLVWPVREFVTEKLPLEEATTLKYAPSIGAPLGFAIKLSGLLCAA